MAIHDKKTAKKIEGIKNKLAVLKDKLKDAVSASSDAAQDLKVALKTLTAARRDHDRESVRKGKLETKVEELRHQIQRLGEDLKALAVKSETNHTTAPASPAAAE